MPDVNSAFSEYMKKFAKGLSDKMTDTFAKLELMETSGRIKYPVLPRTPDPLIPDTPFRLCQSCQQMYFAEEAHSCRTT